MLTDRVRDARYRAPPHRSVRAALSGSSAIAGFRPHRSHRAALPQWALQKGPETGRSSGRLVHTREVRLQGLPALCLALRLPWRDPFLPLPFLHRLVSFGDFIDSMERSDSHLRCGELWLSLVRGPHRRGCVRQVLQRRSSWPWLGGLAELGFLELLEIVHIEVAVSLGPVLVSFDGKGSNEASTSV
jgi:hypothetical protein